MQKTFQHTATSAEPVRPFLSGKLLQLMLQCLFIIDGFPQFLFAFFQLPIEFFQLCLAIGVFGGRPRCLFSSDKPLRTFLIQHLIVDLFKL